MHISDDKNQSSMPPCSHPHTVDSALISLPHTQLLADIPAAVTAQDSLDGSSPINSYFLNQDKVSLVRNLLGTMQWFLRGPSGFRLLLVFISTCDSLAPGWT